MPYENELASKSSHSDIVRNPEVASFLENCEYLRRPSEEEVRHAIAEFKVPPDTRELSLPEHIIAIDGSYYEASISDQLPSTKVGYIKLGCVLIKFSEFSALRDTESGLVDPMRVARLGKGSAPLTMTVPSANLLMEGESNVRDSFRRAVSDYFGSTATRFVPQDQTTSLRSTLFELASRRSGGLGTNKPDVLVLHRCPCCNEPAVEVRDSPNPQRCPRCHSAVYPTDCLRVWEDVTDFQSNAEAMSRLMIATEHLLPIHYIRYLANNSLASLASTAFFVDGPLAVFGNPAWIHGPIMSYLSEINARLETAGLSRLVMIGIQKTGQVADHLQFLDRFLPNNRLLPITDDYRYEHILAGRDPSSNGFGSETYYGQDFILKTPSGRTFVFALPYPFSSKSTAGLTFAIAKTEIDRYAELARAIAVIQHFESDLYANAVVPVALAHRHTAISLVPGGRVLDLLSKQHFSTIES